MKTIPTAAERMVPGAPAHDIIPCMLEEITDLRAALAATAPESAPAVPRDVVVGGLRMIPDSECVQGKCGCATTGCWGECSMRCNPVMFGQSSNGITISVGAPVILPSQRTDQVRDAPYCTLP